MKKKVFPLLTAHGREEKREEKCIKDRNAASRPFFLLPWPVQVVYEEVSAWSAQTGRAGYLDFQSAVPLRNSILATSDTVLTGSDVLYQPASRGWLI